MDVRAVTAEDDFPEWQPAPWYLTAVRGVHTAVGVLGVLLGAGLMGSCVLALATGTPAYPWAILSMSFGTVALALGVLFLASGEAIRKRRRRGLSLCCGILLFFTGPAFVLGLASVIALTRPRALDYYDSTATAPAFPVLPARHAS